MSQEVYIIHSDKKVALSLERTLRIGGFSVKVFSSGESALREIEANRPAVALIDILLPDLPGLVLMYSARSVSPSTECIVISAEEQANSAEASVNLGAFSYLLTPCSPKQLLVTVRTAVAKSQLEESCNEYEVRINELSEFIDDCVYMIDSVLRIHYVNKSAARFLGQPANKLIGMPIRKVFSESDNKQMTRELRHVLSTGEQHIGTRSFDLNGKEVFLQTMLMPVRDREGAFRFVQGISRIVPPPA